MWGDSTVNNMSESGTSKVYNDYIKRLETLTSGSKPLITSLTLAAQALSYDCNSIVKAIEDQIRKVEPNIKLPLLYLVDSIVKNSGGVYIQKFSSSIAQVFTEAYKQVSFEQQEKFDRVLSTWISNEIFDGKVLNRINTELRALKAPTKPRTSNVVHVNPKFVPKLESKPSPSPDFNLQAKNTKQELTRPSFRPPVSKVSNTPSRPNGSFPQHRPPFERGSPYGTSRPKVFPPPTLDNKRKHFGDHPARPFPGQRPEFRPFRPNRPHFDSRFHYERPRPYIKHSSPAHYEKHNRPYAPRLQHPMPFNPRNPNLSFQPPPFGLEHEPAYEAGPYMEDEFNGPGMNFSHPEPILPPPQPIGNIPPPRPSAPNHGFLAPGFNPISEPQGEINNVVDPNLLKSLLDSGVLHMATANMASTPLTIPTFSQPPSLSSNPMSVGSTFNISSLTALDSSIGKPDHIINLTQPFSDSVILSHKHINTRREGAAAKLYDETTLQCRQCGLRYPSGEGSQERLDSHMDWHFRINRKKKDRATLKRFQSRSWFSSDQDWSQSKDTEFDYQQEPAFFNEDVKPQNEIAQAIAQLEKSTVVVPADHSGQACPICHDKFTSCWSDELEDWIYKNATQVNGQICHATCSADHASLISKKSLSPFKNSQDDSIKNVAFSKATNSNLMV